MSEQERQEFREWAVLELMGHRRLGGLVSEQTLFGTAMLRIDIPGDHDAPEITQFYGGGSVYCLTPTTEAMARAVAKHSRPTPVTRWELPEAIPVTVGSDDADDDAVEIIKDLPF